MPADELIRRLRRLFHRDRFDRDLRDEMRLHLELREEEQRERGLPPLDAHTNARRNFGNPAVLAEVSSDAWGWRWLEDFLQDLRYGARSMLRTPGFTATAVIALALGIGANTAIFSVVNAILLRPLAYKDSDRLVVLLHRGTDPVAVSNYIDWRDQNRSFEATAAAEAWSPNLTNADPPEHLPGLHVSQNLLPMLGVEPLLGRFFLPSEDRKGSEHEVMIGYSLWQRRFGGSRDVLGRPVTLDGQSYTIVGVMPRGFKFAPFWSSGDLWAPATLGDRPPNRGGNSLRVFARVKPGTSLAQARADIAAITARLEQRYPGTNRGVTVTPLKEKVVGKIETPLLVLLGAVGFVLLIACANVAHMLLARAAAREKEIAVRTALGAGRLRVIRQHLTENMLLAAMGSGAGFLLALAGIRALAALSPPDMPRVDTVTIDVPVALFLLGVTAVTSVAFGLAPALQTSAVNLAGSLKEGGRGSSDGIRRNRLRSILVASEFALALVLLIGAGLMIRSFFALQSIDPGFNPHHLLSMEVQVAGSKEALPHRRAVFYPQLLEKIRALPGVESAGGINHLPLAGDLWGWSFLIEGRPKPRPGETPTAVYRIVMPGYFRTMNLPLVRGRDIAHTDNRSAPGVVIVNEQAARSFWPGQDSIGQRISFDSGKIWLTVIGIARDAKQYDWAAAPFPEVYLAAMQQQDFLENQASFMAYLTLVVRTSGDPAALASAVKDVVWSFDRNLPISQVVTMDGVVANANAQPRFEMMLLGVFAIVALTLAAVGIYGVMSYSVSRRTQEIGIRMSLGATRAEVLGLVVRQGMTLALAGSAAGIAAALLLARLMTKMLYGVRPADPVTFAGVAVVLILVALLASYIPARRATRIDPMVALRYE